MVLQHALGDEYVVQLPEHVLLPVATQHALYGGPGLQLARLHKEHSAWKADVVIAGTHSLGIWMKSTKRRIR